MSETTETGAAAQAYMGRARVLADYESVDASNVSDVMRDALPAFWGNRAQARYLWDYYRGRHPVLDREKPVRPEICNKVVENHAQEIVVFKIGYQLAEPLQYTLRNHEGTVGPEGGEGETEEGYESHLADLNELNTLMHAADKASSDRDLFEHMCVCGVGYRMCEAASGDDADAPFELHVLDPWDTFVIRSSSYHHRPVAAVWAGREQDGSEREIYNVYTEREFFLLDSGFNVLRRESHTYGRIPIVEYPLNTARMGVFEPVLPLLDAIDTIESNRLDGIEQTVQSLMKFIDCDVDEATFQAMLSLGAVKVKTVEGRRGDVDFITNNLDQSQTQVTKDDLYQAVVNICGMPNRNGTSGSSSDTGAAVLLRDGWTLAESHAKSYELQFKRSEREFLRCVLAICEQSSDARVELRLRDIELAFNRRNYENVLVKAQVLTTMLDSDSIHPEIAFKSCGMFTDPEAAYLQSARWAQERAEEAERKAREIASAQGPAPGDPGPQAGEPQEQDGDDASVHTAANA